MKIVWDEPKRLANLDKHGLDFAQVNAEFFADAMVVPAKEGRYKAIGRLADGTVVIIFALLGSEAISIISMRAASQRERRLIE